jgi:exoribonuclease-2
VKLHPASHAGLGLEVYTQATSPIRRYTDMLVHWQIKAHLHDRPLPFTTDQLDMLLKGLEPAIAEANQVERLTQRYWTLVYLQEQQDRVWQVTLLDWLRENDKLALVIFDDLGIKLPMRLQKMASIGDTLQIKVSEVEPRQDVIQFVEVS